MPYNSTVSYLGLTKEIVFEISAANNTSLEAKAK